MWHGHSFYITMAPCIVVNNVKPKGSEMVVLHTRDGCGDGCTICVTMICETRLYWIHRDPHGSMRKKLFSFRPTRLQHSESPPPLVPPSIHDPNLLPDVLMLVPLCNSLLHVLTLHLHFCRPVLKLLQLLVASTVMDASKEADRIKKALALEPSISRVTTRTSPSDMLLL